MRDQEDQMDRGSAGAMRGQGHVRIPQRRITRSLRSGVSPSMTTMNAGNGQFQNGVHISPRVQPIRQMGPNRGRMFQQFMNRATKNPFQQARGRGFGGGGPQPNPIMQHIHDQHDHVVDGGRNHWQGIGNMHPQGNPILQNLLRNTSHYRGGTGMGPNGGMRSPSGAPQFGHPMPPEGPPNTMFPPAQGGQPPHQNPLGQLLGHGQSMNGMVQAIMDDLGQGINPAQFARMQAGTLPGGEGGDFLRALGGGDMNNNPLQALVQHLIQGQAGADGTPGNYMINGDQGGAIAQLLRQAIGNNPNYNPPPPRRGNRFMPPNPWQGGGFNGSGGYPSPIPLGIPQAGIPR